MDKQDLINRKDAIDAVCEYCEYFNNEKILERIKSLPSAEPEMTLESAIDYLNSIDWLPEHDRIITESAKRKSAERKGKWIILDECANEGIYCSECHKKVLRYDYSNTMKLRNFNFCPNCGVDMRPDNASLADDSIYDRSGRTGGN